MKQKIIYPIVFIILFLAIAWSWKNSSGSLLSANDSNEGTVVYKITYMDDNPFKDKFILPHETNLFFKGANASFITTSMGVVQMVNLLDNKNKKFTSLLLNSIGNNYAFTEAPDDVKMQENSPIYKIETTDNTKLIAGLECNKAIVTDVTHKKKFDIYYYKKIKVFLGNSPYKDFNYLLMEYQDTRYGLPMNLQASKVDFNPVDTSMLSVHGNYRWVDRKSFLSIVESMKVAL